MKLFDFTLRCRAATFSAVTAISIAACSVANALPITWNFTGVLDDGATASGQFTLSLYGYLSDGSFINTTSGSVLAGAGYSRPGNPTSILPSTPPAFGVAFYSGNYNRWLWLNFANDLETPGINPLDLSHLKSFECFAWSCPGPGQPASNANTRFFVSGTATAVGFAPEPGQTPIPGALPLFASGLGAFGLLTWRRRKRTQRSA